MTQFKHSQNVNPAKKNYKRTGRITDSYHNWNTLPHELKITQRVFVALGVCIQTSLLIIGILVLAGEFFY